MSSGAALNVPGCASWVTPGLASVRLIDRPSAPHLRAPSLSAQAGSVDLPDSESIRYLLNYFIFKVSLNTW